MVTESQRKLSGYRTEEIIVLNDGFSNKVRRIQAEVELRLTQAEAVGLQFGCELSILCTWKVSYEEDRTIVLWKMNLRKTKQVFLESV